MLPTRRLFTNSNLIKAASGNRKQALFAATLLSNSSKKLIFHQYRHYSVNTVHTNQQQPLEFTSSQQPEVDSVKVLKKQILDLAIEKYVPTLGWTIEAIAQASKDLKLSPMASSQLFATGYTALGPETELIQHFLTTCNRSMSAQIQLMDKTGMDTATIIKKAIRVRLEMVAPYVKAGKWTEAMSTFIFGTNPMVDNPTHIFNQLSGFKTSGTTNGLGPVNQVQGLNALYQAAILSDEICHIAGIRDSDIQWYVKRAAVGMVYTSCEFYMLTDNSPDFQDTWNFLDRRIDELVVLQSANSTITSAVQGLMGGLLSLVFPSNQPQANSTPSSTPTNPPQ